MNQVRGFKLSHLGALILRLQPTAHPVLKLQETAQTELKLSLLPSPLKTFDNKNELMIGIYEETAALHHTLNDGLVVDETLQHHHQASRPLGERAVGVLLQEGEEFRSDLGQHGGHVVSCQGVTVVQVHHCILQVARQGHRGKRCQIIMTEGA